MTTQLTQTVQPVLDPFPLALAKRVPPYLLAFGAIILATAMSGDAFDPGLVLAMVVGALVGASLHVRGSQRLRVPGDARGPAVLVVRHPQDYTGRLAVSVGDRTVRMSGSDCWVLVPVPAGQHTVRVRSWLLRSQPALVDVAEGPALLVGVSSTGRLGVDGLALETSGVPAAPHWSVPLRQVLPQLPFLLLFLLLLEALVF